jgi:hypothetical protein
VTKREINVCFKHYLGKLNKKQTMEKLGVTNEHTFKNIYYHATLDNTFEEAVAKTYAVN